MVKELEKDPQFCRAAGTHLSKILRHDAEKRGILHRADGYILISDLLNQRSVKEFGIDLVVLKALVAIEAKV